MVFVIVYVAIDSFVWCLLGLTAAINESDFELLATPYLEWRQSLSSGFGNFLRNRLRTPGSVELCRRNVKFILGQEVFYCFVLVFCVFVWMIGDDVF